MNLNLNVCSNQYWWSVFRWRCVGHVGLLSLCSLYVLPHERESRAVLDSGFHAANSRFQVTGFQYLSKELGFWIPHREFRIPGNWIPVSVSGTWTLDSNRLWDSGFLELYSGFQKPRIPDSLSKNFSDSGIRTPLPWAICRVAFAPAQKLYRVGPLFTQNNGYFGAISVTEQSCAASISEVETHVSERCSILYRIDFDIGQGPINVNN